MKLENLRQDFPEMPDEIRVMVEQEVYRQINTNTTKRPSVFREQQANRKAIVLVKVNRLY